MSKTTMSTQHTLTPHMVIKDACKAIDFYKKAFGAEELYRFEMPDGKIMHASLKIGDSHLFLTDEIPSPQGCNRLSPQTLKGAHATIHMQVADVDKAYARAVEVGATVVMPPADMFWGDRYAQVVDPFGQPWSIATHKENLEPEEIKKRGAEFFKQMACAK
jgi:PhnB protein